MSLEVVIQENTAAIRELIAAIAKGAPIPADAKEVVATPPKPTTSAATRASAARTQPTAKEAADAAPGKTADASSQSAKPAETEQQGSTAATEITYQDAANAVTKLSRAKGRDAAVAVLKQFDAANLKEVKPEQFAEVIAAVNEVLGA